MTKSMDVSNQSAPSFYSDKSYEFHPYADLFPLMNNEGIKKLGLSVKKNGQHQDIVLLDDLILDGRNTYLACKMFAITPRFQYYNNDLDPLVFVMVRNLHRRHLSSAQKAEIALEFLKIEKRKARERQICSRFGNKEKNKAQSTARGYGILTVQNMKKGKSIDIVAKEFKMSAKTINKADKIKEAAKKSPEIQKQWEMAKRNEISLEEVYKKTEKINNIRKGIVDKFVKTGDTIARNRKKEGNQEMDTCSHCPKATNIAIKCGKCGSLVTCKCGNPVTEVICDDDVAKGISKVRNPFSKRCKASYN